MPKSFEGGNTRDHLLLSAGRIVHEQNDVRANWGQASSVFSALACSLFLSQHCRRGGALSEANTTLEHIDIVTHAIRLGHDTDTTACLAGGIAGLRHGKSAIPPEWLATLRGQDILQPLLEKFPKHS